MWVRGLKLNVSLSAQEPAQSHPMWVRGLKLAIAASPNASKIVAPYVGAWIETFERPAILNAQMSHPMWVRGLKPVVYNRLNFEEKSHPMWVRGLKPSSLVEHVATLRRTLCGCVD